jgi:hypothetical protein
MNANKKSNNPVICVARHRKEICWLNNKGEIDK